MRDQRLKLHTSYDIGSDTFQLQIGLQDPLQRRRALVAAPLTFLAAKDWEPGPAPVFIGSPTPAVQDGVELGTTEFLQGVLNFAWDQGLRPQGFAGTENEIKRMESHLSDMRALVFKPGQPA